MLTRGDVEVCHVYSILRDG